MKTINLKKLLPFLSLILIVIVMSSCNRGIGCPSEFSMSDDIMNMVIDAVQNTATHIIQ